MANEAVVGKLGKIGKNTESKEKFKKIMNKYGIFFILFAMVMLITALSPAFLTVRNLLNVVRQISVIGIIAFGATFIMITGGIDLSAGSLLALSAVIAASLAQRPDWVSRMYPDLPALPVIVPILAALAIGAFVGFINGSFVARTGIPAFIATLGSMVAVRGAALIYADGRPISYLNDSYNFIGQGTIGGVPVPILIFAVVGVVSYWLLNCTKFGKFIFAIGGNENAAFVSGVNIKKYKILVYTYGGLLAGLAGVVLSSRISSGQPGLGLAYEMDAIAAGVIGGTSQSGGIGTVGGTIVGALIIGVLNNGLDLLNVSAYWQQIIKGVIIVGAVVLDVLKNKQKR